MGERLLGIQAREVDLAEGKHCSNTIIQVHCLQLRTKVLFRQGLVLCSIEDDGEFYFEELYGSCGGRAFFFPLILNNAPNEVRSQSSDLKKGHGRMIE